MRPIRSDRSWCETALLIAFGLPQAGQLAAVTVTLPSVLLQTKEARGLGDLSDCLFAAEPGSHETSDHVLPLGGRRVRGELSELRQGIEVAPMNRRAEEAT
jgi:hypothetical protein